MNETETGKAHSEVLWNDKIDPSILEVDNRSCQLLGPTALAVQGLMGILVILSLIYKRHREEHKRPWKIWIFDISKQVVGQMFVHGVNLLISDIISHHDSSNACVSYFLNILVDTTLGVLILYGIHHGLTYIITERFRLQGFESGVYGKPPSIAFWTRQATVYVFSLTTMKFAVIGLLALFPGLYKIGEWLLSWTWTEEGDDLQVIFTMGIFPIIMNILQFWIIDSIVKASDAPVALGGDSPAQDHADREPLFGIPSDDEDEDDHATQRRPHDIENPPISRSNEPKTQTRTPTSDGDESKVSHSNAPGNSLEFHSYPPSLTNSATSFSSNSSMGSSIREATKLNKKKKRPPSPLNLRPQYQPAINSPQVAAVTPSTPGTVPQAANDEWTDSWEDSDDWAGRVGEEEWTGRRLVQTNASLHNVWGTSTVAVS